MQCPQCQHENPAGQKFCGECGVRLQAPCPTCQTVNPPGQKFCGECGTSLAAVRGPVPTPLPAPESYTPRHLAERVLTSRAALEGERKQVTVLFADLKGSMELLADRDPEEARAILDPVLERMMEAVHRYEGTVNQVLGDGIMALFGAPLAHEDHAVRACYAALCMQESVRQYADEVRRAEGITPQIRVGLNSGEVVVRSIGSDLRMDYTAVGQTTHLAARMEQVATPGSVLLAPETLQLAEGYVEVKALGPMAVKGLAEPVAVYELVGTGAARTRLQAAAARGFTKFVGRDAELNVLRQTLERAAGGRGQVVAAVGEPGVGKSRLAYEFTHSHRAQGWLVLEAGSVSYGKATSYLPVIDLLRSYCGIEASDDHRRMREKVLGKLLTLDRALEPTLPALLALLDVPVEDPGWEALDPPQRRQRTIDAVKRLLLRESQEQPLLVVFEDLHWIDAETQALLDSLVESLPTARLLLLVNYRPEYEHAWHRKTYYRELRLDPLPPESAHALLTALLGDGAVLGALEPLLIERTEGNPFLLEETVRTLVETGVLGGERGAYRLARPPGSMQVPATVQAVLSARIDRLAPEDKRLLQAAAVIGKDVPYAQLAAIAELPEAALQQGLGRLQAAEFLYETSLFPALEHTFKHALTHEVAYGSLLQERRRALHVQVLEALERLYTDRQAEQVEKLAHHAFRGERWKRAVVYLRQAAAKAEARAALREAVASLEAALVALARLPDSPETREQAFELRLDLRNALVPLGESGRAVAYLQEAEAIAETLGDRRRMGRLAATLAESFIQQSDGRRALEASQRALAIAVELGDRVAQVEASIPLARALWGLGDYRRAADLLRGILASLEGHLGHGDFSALDSASVSVRAWLARCLAEQGEFAEGRAQANEAVRMAGTIDHPFRTIAANLASGQLHLCQGELGRAMAVLDHALGLCHDWGMPLLIPLIGSSLGYAYALSGRVTEGLPLLQQALAQAASMEIRAYYSNQLAQLGEVYVLAGRGQEAAELAGRALTHSRDHAERGSEAWALRLLGEIAAHADPPDVQQAEAHYRQALALAEELGMRPLVAHCHLGLGTLYRKTGRDEQAQVELTAAAEMYRAMEMPFWLTRVETAPGQVAS